LKRHLTTLETDPDAAARPGGLTLATAAAGLPMAARFALAEALAASKETSTNTKDTVWQLKRVNTLLPGKAGR
jgi:hypothetical protein